MTTPERSRNMAAIKGKDTKPEMIVRKYLWSHGFRYRLNNPRLPGKPDIVLRKYRTCIFVNGCFWHGHDVSNVNENANENEDANENVNENYLEIQSSECCKIPRTNREFWVKKILRNRERDTEVMRKLAQMGWHTLTIWECELKPSICLKTLESLAYTLNHIYLQDRMPRQYADEDEHEQLMVAEDTE